MSKFDNITVGVKSAIGIGVAAIILVSGIVVAYDEDQGRQDKKIHRSMSKDRVQDQKDKEMDRRITIQEDLYRLQYELNARQNALPPAGAVPVPK